MKDGFQGQRSYRLPLPLLHEAVAHPLCRGLHLTDIGFYPVAKAHKRTRRTGSAQYILLYCVQGGGWYQINDDEKHALKASQWVILPAHVPHKYAADEDAPWTIYWLHFSGTQAPDLYAYLLENIPVGPVSVLPTDERFRLFEDLFSQLTRSATLAGLVQASARLSHFLLTLLPAANPPAAASTITQSIEFMREHLARSFTVSDLAAQAGLSTSYYSAQFRAQVGRSPIAFLNFLKIQAACQHLIYSKSRINEVARKCGFDDVYYFSRMFTKVMGISPRQFRQAERA